MSIAPTTVGRPEYVHVVAVGGKSLHLQRIAAIGILKSWCAFRAPRLAAIVRVSELGEVSAPLSGFAPLANRHVVDVLAAIDGDACGRNGGLLLTVDLLGSKDLLRMPILIREGPVECHAIGEIRVAGAKENIGTPFVRSTAFAVGVVEGVTEGGEHVAVAVFPHDTEVGGTHVPRITGVRGGSFSAELIHQYGWRRGGAASCFCARQGVFVATQSHRGDERQRCGDTKPSFGTPYQ